MEKNWYLKPWQSGAADTLLRSLKAHGAALDASDTGTGKTYVAAEVCRRIGANPVVICPKPLLTAWKETLCQAGRPPVCVINYEKARTKTWDHLPRTLFIFDEVHRCKGHKTRQGRLLTDVAKCGHPVLMLSATPAQSPLEMKGLGYALGLHNGGSHFWKWCRQHGCIPGKWGGFEFAKNKQENMASIHRQIFHAGKGCRIKIDDLEGFPENQVIVHSLDMGLEIQEEYDSVRAELVALKARCREDKDPEHVLTKILRARQRIELLKVPVLKEMIELKREDGFSVVCFVNFRETLGALEKALAEETSVILGGQSVEERDANLLAFQNNDTFNLLGTISCAGTGIGAHDIRGDHPRISLLNPDFSARNFLQALGRIHRAGGKSRCIQYALFAAGTFEERVRRVVESKRSCLETLNDGDFVPSP